VVAASDGGNGGVVDGVCVVEEEDCLLLSKLFVGVGVVCCHGSQLASGSTFLFLSANITTWSVRSPRVYKHS
jgi:hypothetical protein